MMEFLTVIFMITCVFVTLNVGFLVLDAADDFWHRILSDRDKRRRRQ